MPFASFVRFRTLRVLGVFGQQSASAAAEANGEHLSRRDSFTMLSAVRIIGAGTATAFVAALIIPSIPGSLWLSTALGAAVAGLLTNKRAWLYGGIVGLLIGVFACIVLFYIGRPFCASDADAARRLWHYAGLDHLFLKVAFMVMLGGIAAEASDWCIRRRRGRTEEPI